jgi:hypothetical protein
VWLARAPGAAAGQLASAAVSFTPVTAIRLNHGGILIRYRLSLIGWKI